jgi:hypothetical protein
LIKNVNLLDSRQLKIIWVGRFVWFKITSIEYIIKSLEYLSNNYISSNISLDIIGYGNKESEDELIKLIDNTLLNVNILGGVDYDQLPEIFEQYDIGIGMGLTIKNMADCALPSILIDSIKEADVNLPCCEWFHNSDIDDAGDGFYGVVSGLENKK